MTAYPWLMAVWYKRGSSTIAVPVGRRELVPARAAAALVPCPRACTSLHSRTVPDEQRPVETIPSVGTFPPPALQNGDIKEVMEKADKMAAEIAGK